jgi:N-acetylmuramoyl-L-alanine amidase
MKTIILGTAHLESTPGKRSPDGKFREYKYSRKICKTLKSLLTEMGYQVFIDVEQDDLKLTQSQELKYRCDVVNSFVKQYKDCIYVSVHINAAGNGSQWMKATGWSAYTSVGKTKADKLAECLYDSAKIVLKDKKLRTDNTDGDSDMEAHLYVLKHTNCPAVLTENFFQDNKEDVEFLESDEGFHKIIKVHLEGILKYLKDN